jgi:ubiquinone/menaquinone biosynthesis C-methylase UbiE
MIDLVGITYHFSANISSQFLHTDLQHHLYTLSLDGALGFAPPNLKGSKLNRVLDVGTGTGIWAIDFGMISRPHCATELTL